MREIQKNQYFQNKFEDVFLKCEVFYSGLTDISRQSISQFHYFTENTHLTNDNWHET